VDNSRCTSWKPGLHNAKCVSAAQQAYQDGITEARPPQPWVDTTHIGAKKANGVTAWHNKWQGAGFKANTQEHQDWGTPERERTKREGSNKLNCTYMEGSSGVAAKGRKIKEKKAGR